jgi:hypothetical protein
MLAYDDVASVAFELLQDVLRGTAFAEFQKKPASRARFPLSRIERGSRRPGIKCRVVIRKTLPRRSAIEPRRDLGSLPVAGERRALQTGGLRSPRQLTVVVNSVHCPLAIDFGAEARLAPIKSCEHRPLKRLSLIAFEHIGTQEIRGMLILVCALTLALAIGACVGALMVRLRADKMALVRRDAVSGLNSRSPRPARRPPQRPTEPPASRS